MLIIRGPNGEDVKPCDICEQQKTGDCKDAAMWLRYGCCGAYKDWEQRQIDMRHFARMIQTFVEEVSKPEAHP